MVEKSVLVSGRIQETLIYLGCEEDETLEKHASLVSNFDTALNFLFCFDSFSEIKDTLGLIQHLRICCELLSINSKELKELEMEKELPLELLKQCDETRWKKSKYKFV